MGNSPSVSEAAVRSGRITHYFTDAAWMDGRATQQLAATSGLCGMIAVAGYPDLHPGRNGPVGAAFLADRLFPALVGKGAECRCPACGRRTPQPAGAGKRRMAAPQMCRRRDQRSVPLAGSRGSFSYLLAPTGAADTPFASLSHGAGRKHDHASMHGRIR